MANRSREIDAQELHQRLLQGDPLAPEALAEAFLEELERRLRVRARGLEIRDDTLIVDAAIDALLNYGENPASFDPTKSRLLTYLTMSAYGDLLNMLARQARRTRREVPLENVEDSLSGGNSTVEGFEDDVLERYGIATEADRAALWQRVAQEFPDPVDRRLLDLILLGERRTGAYSAALGIRDQEFREQQRVVKRHKDRITKRLQRLGGKLREHRPDH